MEGEAPPRTEDMVPIFRRLYEACMERGLPIGVAPNVHVSLVMLPEECATLSSRKFLAQRGKLALLKAVFRGRFQRSVDRAMARSRHRHGTEAGARELTAVR